MSQRIVHERMILKSERGPTLRLLTAPFLTLLLFALLPAGEIRAENKPLSWAGEGNVRIVVNVKSQPDDRAGDERPVEVVLHFEKLLEGIDLNRRPDLTTLQVIRHDAATGKAIVPSKYAFGRSPFDVPFRWYDDAIGYEFPEVVRAVSYTGEKLQYEQRTRFGYFYDCIGDWKSGRLAFLHRVEPDRQSRYAIYFNLLPENGKPAASPPRGFLGDGMHRCLPQSPSTTGLIHSRVEVVDWDNDGLFDLLVGCGRGGIVWYPNRGREGEPRFPYSKLIRTADGRPLDVGFCAAPHVVDWDGDGLFDLLVGGEWNRILLYRNRGKPGNPVLDYAGPLRTESGEILTLPYQPVPESPPDVFKRDYYPLLETADWDGDGDRDLLAGGYVTGRIFLFENRAKPGEIPRFREAGPLTADGTILDVGWCAAPAVADLDNDGDLDLITGCMPVKPKGGDAASREKFLHYFRNEGTRNEPVLHKVEFPRKGEFPYAALGSPRLIDWNNDKLPDLVVSAGKQIYLFRNVGTAGEPLFEAHEQPLPSRWGSAALSAVQLIDWNKDGHPDGVNGTRVFLNTGRGNPWLFKSPFSLLKPDQEISHLSGIGDDWQFQRLFDLDADGILDLMDADHGGHVWWHRNRGKSDKPDFETEGVRLSLVNDQPVRVGLNREGFNALQGARATYTVGEFNGDNRNDLIVADTFGIVRYFRQSSRSAEGAPLFEEPVTIGKLRIRCVPFAADWNNDGRTDVVAGSSADDAVVFLNRGTSEKGNPFLPAKKLELSSAPYGAGAPLVVADFNQDGDVDLMINTAYGYTCWYERSFIEQGYARASVVRIEQRDEKK